MPNLATAYVQIVPTAKGIKNAISNEIGPEAEKAGQDSGGKFSSFFSGALKTGGAAIGAALTAATATATALAKSAVEGYAEFEQLAGGVETLFGAGGQTLQEYADSTGRVASEVVREYGSLMNAQNAVMENASEAYKTAGLSANEYMETATSFAAALVSGLGGDTELAAEMANTAIVDMSDNANKMGSDMASIQTAYQGFAKQNFTMLDNLKLGYGGTASEMVRLINDSGVLNEEISSMDGISFDTIISAVHAVQENMGIAGTTAKEASSTIEGSLGMAKSSWANLVTGIADENANMDELIGNLVESIISVADNLVPRIQIALEGIGSLISGLTPVIAEQLPGLAEAILPGLIESAITLANGVLTALPEILTILTNSIPGEAIGQLVIGFTTVLPELITVASEIILTLISGISQSLPELIPAAVSCVVEIVTGLVGELPQILDAALQLITGLAQGILDSIPIIIEALPEVITGIVNFLIDSIPQIIDTGIQLFTALVEALPEIIETIVNAIPEIIVAIVNFLVNSFPEIMKAGVNLFISLIENLPQIIVTIVRAIPQIIAAIVQGFVDSWPEIKQAGVDLINQAADGLLSVISGAGQWGKDLIDNFIGGITAKWQALKDKVSSIASTVKSYIGFSEPEVGPLSNFHTFAPDMMDLFVSGIEDGKSSVQKAIGDIAGEASVGLQTGITVEPVEGFSATAMGRDGGAATLDDILRELKSIGLYIDGDILVGSLISRIERDLGDRLILAGRGASV